MSGKTAYIILFRGVGGATQLPTAPLREALTEAGFDKVATYINSGNAVLVSRLSRDKVIAKVEKICREKFGFNKAIYAPTLEEWKDLIGRNPFPAAAAQGKFLHAALLADEPEAEAVEALKSLAGKAEGFAVVDKVAYIHTPIGFSNSKLAERFDKTIGVPNTARNWNTVIKLHELASKAKG